MNHLCLVSEQPVPNFLPAAASGSSIRPERVVLAVSETMRKKAEFLRAALESRQIRCETLPVPDPYSLPDLQKLFIDWLDAHAEEDVALNVTGGTKPMAIAAQEAFRMAGKAVFYVNVESDELFWMDRERPSVVLQRDLPLKTYLQIHGYTMQEGSSPVRKEWKTLGKTLVDSAPHWQLALSKLNYHAMDAERRDVLDVGRVGGDDPRWRELMTELYGNEIIRDLHRLHFRSPEARSFANGGWIEAHVLDVVRKLDAATSPCANLQITDPEGNRNEIDVAFLSRNRLFLVECKTKRLDRDPDDFHGPAAEAVYKLDALRRVGGLRTKGILVSFMPVEDRHKHRAAAAGITVIDQQGLPRLAEMLANAVR